MDATRGLNEFNRGKNIPSMPEFDHFFLLSRRFGSSWGDKAWKEFQKFYSDKNFKLFFKDLGLIYDQGGVTGLCDWVNRHGGPHRPLCAGMMAMNLAYNNRLANWALTRLPLCQRFDVNDVKQRLKTDGERYVNSEMMFQNLSKLVSVPPFSDIGFIKVMKEDKEDAKERLTGLYRDVVDVEDGVLLYGIDTYFHAPKNVYRMPGHSDIDEFLADRSNPFQLCGLDVSASDARSRLLQIERNLGGIRVNWGRRENEVYLASHSVDETLEHIDRYQRRPLEDMGLSAAAMDIKFGGADRVKLIDEEVNREIYSLSPRLADEWRLSKRIDMRGQIVETPEDLAALFSVYRHPHLEQTHHIYFADKECTAIAGHNMVSVGLTGISLVYDAETPARGVYNIRDRMNRLNAKGFCVMHNHPSGDVTPSDADKHATSVLAQDLGNLWTRFMGHIILDHDKFSFIHPNLDVEEMSYDGGNSLYLNHPRVSTHGPQEIAKLGAAYIHNEKKTAMLVLSMTNDILGWVPLTESQLHYQNVYQKMREYGGEAVAFVTNDIKMYDKTLDVARDGVHSGHKLCVLDNVWFKDTGKGEVSYVSAREKGHLWFEGGLNASSNRYIKSKLESLKRAGAGFVWAPSADYDVSAVERQNIRFARRDGTSTDAKNLLTMEEARATVPEVIKNWLSNIWNTIIKKTHRNINGKNEIELGPISNKVRDAVNAFYGKSISKQIITLKGLKHIYDTHGSDITKELNDGQIPMTLENIGLIPDVLAHPDYIRKGSKTKRGGYDTLVISKQYADGTLHVVDAIIKNNALEVWTAYTWSKEKTIKKSLTPEVMITVSDDIRFDQRPTMSTFHDQMKVSTEPNSNNNILNFPEKSKKKNNFFSGDYSPTPIPPKEFGQLLDRLGKTGLAKDVITDAEAMRKRLEEEFGEEPAARYMNVWHGSPHAFDRFSTAHIGTGEGTLVYGFGLYFTDLRGIAEGYAKTLSRTTLPIQVFIDGEEVDNSSGTLKRELANIIRFYSGDIKQARDYIVSENNEDWLALIDNKTLQVEMPPSAHNLYEVKIHGDKTADELNFIRWDEPPTASQLQQIMKQAAKESLERLFYRDESTGELMFPGGMRDGEWLYKHELSMVLGSPKAASAFLLRAGIDGIQYPTGYLSNGSHDGSCNYVVFDDAAIEIAEHVRLMSTPKGEVYGFATEDSKIYLDPNKMNANTPIHEYGHLWLDMVKRDNKPLYDRFVEAAQDSDVYRSLRNNEAYKDLNDVQLAEEAAAFAIGNNGEAIFDGERWQTFGERVKACLNDLWQWISERLFDKERKAMVHELAPEQVRDMTFDELAQNAAKDLLSGKQMAEKPTPEPDVSPTLPTKNNGIRFNIQPTPRMAKYFEKCAERLGDTDYPQTRSLNIDVLRRFNVGYDPYFKYGTGSKMWQTLVVPTGNDSFVARNVAADASPADRYRKFGTVQVFNRNALYTSDKPIFVVEGEIDALSIMSVGGEAVALGSVGNIDRFVDMVHNRQPVQPLILALDNDIAGHESAVDLYVKLMVDNDVYCELETEIYGDCKDANELLIKDADRLATIVSAKNQEYEAKKFKPLQQLPSDSTVDYNSTSRDMLDRDFNAVCQLMMDYGSRIEDVGAFFDFYDFRVTDQGYRDVKFLIDRNQVFDSVESACAFMDLRERMCDRFPEFGAEVDKIMGKRVAADVVIGVDSLSLKSDGCNLNMQRHNAVKSDTFLRDYNKVCVLRDYLKSETGFDYAVPSTYAKRMQTDEKWSDYNEVSGTLASLYQDTSKCLQVVKDIGLREFSSAANEPLLNCLQNVSESYKTWESSKWITSVDKKAARLNYMMSDLREACDSRMSRFTMKTVDNVVDYVKKVHNFNLHNITKLAIANTILVKKATPLGLCGTIVQALHKGHDGREWNIQVDKSGMVSKADFLHSGKPLSMIGDIQIKRDVSTGLYTVNCLQKDGKTVCLSNSLDSKTRSNFDFLRVEAEFYSLNKDVQEAVSSYVKNIENELTTGKTVQTVSTGIEFDD